MFIGKSIIPDDVEWFSLRNKWPMSLACEGFLNEVKHEIQNFRKELKFNVSDRIHVKIILEDSFLEWIFIDYVDYVANDILAETIEARVSLKKSYLNHNAKQFIIPQDYHQKKADIFVINQNYNMTICIKKYD